MLPGRVFAGAAAVGLFPHAARAECLGQSCHDAIAAFVWTVAVYALLGLLILGLLIFRRGRWAMGLLAVTVVAAVVPPLVSQGWLAWKLRAMEGREISGIPPDLSGRTVLLLAPKDGCYNDPCAAVLAGKGAAGSYVVTQDALDGLDPERPLDLATLPLQHWVQSAAQGGTIVMRPLSSDEVPAAARAIDYVVMTSLAYSGARQGPLERVLRRNPQLSGLRAGEILRFAMAPLPSGQVKVDLADLQFDIVDLFLSDRALGLPLAPLNWQSAANSAPMLDAVVRSICPMEQGQPDWTCRDQLQ